MSAFSSFGAGVMVFGAGAIGSRGADYFGTVGDLPGLVAPALHPMLAFDSLAGRMATDSPDLYYHLALGTVGAGICPELSKDATEHPGQPSVAAGQHFRSVMPPVHYFGLRRVTPEFAFSGNHFHLPAKPLPAVEVATQVKPSTTQFPDVPTLNQKAPGPNHIIDDPKNAVEHRLP